MLVMLQKKGEAFVDVALSGRPRSHKVSQGLTKAHGALQCFTRQARRTAPESSWTNCTGARNAQGLAKHKIQHNIQPPSRGDVNK